MNARPDPTPGVMRGWLSRNWLAAIAAVVIGGSMVVANVAVSTHHRLESDGQLGEWSVPVELGHGWPLIFHRRVVSSDERFFDYRHLRSNVNLFALAVDLLVLLVGLGATIYTARRIRQCWSGRVRFSLGTLLLLTAILAALAAIVRTDPSYWISAKADPADRGWLYPEFRIPLLIAIGCTIYAAVDGGLRLVRRR